MKIYKPRDYKLLNQFFVLKELVGELKAIVILDSLWIQLGYQLEVHGCSGFFAATEVEAFHASIPEEARVSNLMEKLVTSNWLKPRGENWECDLFFYYNPELDKNHIPKFLGGGFLKVKATMELIKKAAPPMVAEFPDKLWEGKDGVRITPAAMNEAVILIKTVDSILKIGKRDKKEYTLPMIHASVRVCQHYGKAKLSVILNRLFTKRSLRDVPRSTPLLLERFDEVVILVMPDEGYVNWTKQAPVEG